MLVTVGKVGGREGVGAERQDAEIDQEAALCARTSMYVCMCVGSDPSASHRKAWARPYDEGMHSPLRYSGRPVMSSRP